MSVDTSATHADLVHDVMDMDCRTPSGSAHGHVSVIFTIDL